MATSPIPKTVDALQLHASSANRNTVLTCTGKLVMSTASLFTKEVKLWLECSSTMAVDLAGLSYMDSAGLGALVSAYTSAKHAGCEFRLTNVTLRVMHLLQLTNLDKVLKTTTENLL
jgi:anti-sigma B factor antagonist